MCDVNIMNQGEETNNNSGQQQALSSASTTTTSSSSSSLRPTGQLTTQRILLNVSTTPDISNDGGNSVVSSVNSQLHKLVTLSAASGTPLKLGHQIVLKASNLTTVSSPLTTNTTSTSGLTFSALNNSSTTNNTGTFTIHTNNSTGTNSSTTSTNNGNY